MGKYTIKEKMSVKVHGKMILSGMGWLVRDVIVSSVSPLRDVVIYLIEPNTINNRVKK